MRATWRPLPAWPYQPRPKASAPFRMGWEGTLDSLEREIDWLDGEDLVIGVVCDPAQIGLSGNLKAGGRTAVRHPGVEVSFEAGGRRHAHPEHPGRRRARRAPCRGDFADVQAYRASQGALAR